MAENTEIAWTHHTANLWWGCTEVGPGCDHCYARMLAERWGFDIWEVLGPRRYIKGFYKDMDRYQKLAAAAGQNHRVFIGSMMDIFEKSMPLIDSKGNAIANLTTGELRAEFFNQVDIGRWPNLMLLFLTKRPSNIPKYVPAEWLKHPPRNVMYGCSPQTEKDIVDLMKVPGKHFLSMEPLLRAWDITQKTINYSVPTRYSAEGRGIEWTDPGDDFIGVDWVITGGESGNKARPSHPQWYEDLRQQCKRANIPFFMKQWGAFLPESEVYGTAMSMDDIRKKSGYTIWPDGKTAPLKAGDIGVHFDIGKRLRNVGKEAAGHLMDGKEYYEFPEYHSWFLFSNPPFQKNEEAREAFGNYVNSCFIFGKETVDKDGGYDKFVKK